LNVLPQCAKNTVKIEEGLGCYCGRSEPLRWCTGRDGCSGKDVWLGKRVIQYRREAIHGLAMKTVMESSVPPIKKAGKESKNSHQ